jgi:integrase
MRRKDRDSNRLSAARVSSERRPGLYSDGGNLWLRVAPGGSKSWVFRYTRDGRRRHMGLGPIHTWSLAEARERARECRQLLGRDKEPIDPIEARRAERQHAKAEAARTITFRQCAETYIGSHGKSWKNAKHAAQWPATLETYVYPLLGDLPPSAVDTTLVLKVLEPIWHAKPETASRVRGRIESVLDWATVRGYRSGDNPARWRGHLQHILAPRGKIAPVIHRAAMHYNALPAFIADLQTRAGTAARALEFVILTAVRTAEAIGARWPEVDLAAKTWTVPGSRMKGGREHSSRDHKVPLSARALELLSALPREGGADGFVFVGAKAGAGLSNMAMLELLRRMDQPELTVHGFRSTFRDWAAERTSYPNHVVEMALAHVVGDKVEAAYRRGDLFEKRWQLMEAWARYCARPAMIAGDDIPLLRNVVPIGRS